MLQGCPAHFFIVFAANDRHDPAWMHRWQVAAGRGFDRNLAQFAAVSEAIERCCLISGGPADPRVTARGAGPDALDLWQYDHQKLFSFQSNKLNSALQACGQPVDKLWINGFSLFDRTGTTLPATAIFADEDIRLGLPPVLSSSSGTAVRGTFDEAVRHAVLERVERDAVAIWWYNRTLAPRLDPGVVDGLLPLPFTEWLRSRQRVTWHLSVITDLPVGAVVALSSRPDGSRPAIGAAASLDPADAVRAATLELIQGEIALATMRGAQRAPDPPEPPPLLSWSDATNAARDTYLAGSGAAALRKTVTFDALKDAFVRAGIEVWIADLTRPELEVPVARAVSPQLRDWQPRFAPGRLFDVPVTLGHVARPLRKDELNPVPFVI